MKLVSWVFIFFVMVACQEVERPEKPKNLIAKEKMIEILKEAYLGNSARSINNRVMRDDVVELDSLIYRKFGIDSLQFAQSNAYYASQMNEYIAILKEVEERMVVQKRELDTLIVTEAKKRKDSLEAVRQKRKEENDSLPKGIEISPVQN
ncbi:MAG: DUF4296 domain-containing protein [Flavobacteriaceae bacterium]